MSITSFVNNDKIPSFILIKTSIDSGADNEDYMVNKKSSAQQANYQILKILAPHPRSILLKVNILKFLFMQQ